MIYDFKTTNESAIVVAKQLKDLGISNPYIHLTLYDEDLVGVNPFDEENLSLAMKLKIKKEISRNIWYYQREIVRIEESGGTTRYKFHRGNIAQTFCFLLNLDIIEMLPRQQGKTIGAAVNYSWLYNFATINMQAIFSNKQLPDSQLNLTRVKNIIRKLPKYLKAHLDPSKDTDNLNKMRCDSNNNVIMSSPSPKDEASAEKIGRGNTVASLWFDEFSWLKFNKKVFDASAFAYSKAAEAAEKNHVPHSRVLTTTPIG